MSHSKTESLYFYKYLCQKIDSEKIVRARRLVYISSDLRQSHKLCSQITSGSRGEGLDLKGSDVDLMYIDPLYVVYKSDKDVVQDRRIVLVMDTEDTPPCFTQLHLYNNVNTFPNYIKQRLQQHRGKKLLSSGLYKSSVLKIMQGQCRDLILHIHGPCIADKDVLDMAHCLKCDQWVSQAEPWISRSRLMWPSPELISKITSCGTLFVPIGNKGSVNENLQWRISFSVAEKMLIYSFSHTQLLCYVLLKILLKEIVNGEDDLKDLLCSYFLKTVMFWISEENETSVWRPDNIIPCFMACIKRLLYCIEYSTLLHYFVPENNLFYLRFNNKQRNTLINIIKKSYQKGIKIFLSSQTLHDYSRVPYETTRSVCEIATLKKTILNSKDCFTTVVPFANILGLLNTLLHHCKTELSRFIFKMSIAYAYQIIPIALPHSNNPNNKQKYKFYKHDLSQLLVGVQSDAVSGWLILASFFVGHKHYLTSIDIINYTLSKCADESSLSKITLKQADTLKLASLVSFPNVSFHRSRFNSVIPMELKSPHSLGSEVIISSILFAHFLRFLCFYHLHDFNSSRYCINKLLVTVSEYSQSEGDILIIEDSYNFLLLGIAFQMLGERYLAKKYFRIAAQKDLYNSTSAAFRLRQLC